MASLSFSVTSNSITANLKDLDPEYNNKTRCCDWFLNDVYKGRTEIPNGVPSVMGAYTFYDLNPDTTYAIKVCINWYDAANEKWYDSWVHGSAKTDPQKAKIRATIISATNVTLSLYNLDTSYDDGDRYVIYTIKKGSTVVKTSPSIYLPDKIEEGAQYTVSGLEKNTSYNVVADVSANAWSTSFSGSFKTPMGWSWEISNGTASDAQTAAAYSAISGGGGCTEFSYKVWNDMVKMVYDNLGWDYLGLKRDDTYMTNTTAGRTLTADRFNTLHLEIDKVYPTGIPAVSKGDPVLGEHFIMLANALNSALLEKS